MNGIGVSGAHVERRSARRAAREATLALLAVAALAALGPALAATPTLDFADAEMTLVKAPTCSCCDAYAELLRDAGATVTVEAVEDVAARKAAAGVPPSLWSCHTVIVDAYVVEGHVPLTAIKELLETRPQLTGIALPGMPEGSPGMPGVPPSSFDILGFDRTGVTDFGAF